ncbi:g10624 [Coccomyxa viridis]|uniref:G10624 protein n=1 Tax=Coccomyxa viridis TaxID=1274662 RepID=A0ABP1G8C8_9CHLO
MRPPFPIPQWFSELQDKRRRLESQAPRWLAPAFAGISASSPGALAITGRDKNEKVAIKQAAAEEQKHEKEEAAQKQAIRSGDAEADHRSASSEPQKEARHRKDDAAGRSLGEDAHQGKHAPEQGRAPAEGPETAGKARRGNPARHLAGIWKELNDDSMDSDDDKDRDKEQEQEAGGKEADEDAGETVTQARIIAYSDSDSDDPVLPSLPFRRRRADEGSDSDNNADSSSGGSEKKGLFTWRGWNRLDKTFQAEDTGLTKKTATATRNLGGRSMALAKDGATWALILKILLVSLLRRFQPKAVTSFELLCLAVPLPDAMARWMKRSPLSDSFPAGSQAAARDLADFAAPLILARVLRAAVRLVRPEKKPKGIRRSISESVLMLREVAGEEEADRLGGALAGAPEYAVQLSAHRAALHPAELEELQRVLDAQGTKLPRDLFDSSHAELLRYAATHGMLESDSPEQRAVAIEAAAQAIQHTLEWRQKRKFLSPQQLSTWEPLIRWQGQDQEGHPLLIVHIGRLCNECQSHELAQQAADALISQVEHAVRRQMDNEVGPDQLVVVLDAQGASALQVTRKAQLCKDTAVTLNKNYPGRLHKAYLVGLPQALHWMMDTVKPVLHPQTVSSLKVCEVEDLEMPMRGYLQPAGPESPGTPSDTMANGTDNESDWATPRSTMTVPDFATLSTSVSPIPELESLAPLALEAPRVRTHVSDAGRRRVFIPDMPVTPVTERRTPRFLRRTSSSQNLAPGSATASPRLRPALKRASYSGASSSFADPSRLAHSTLRRSSSFPRSHDLKRTLSLGDLVASEPEALARGPSADLRGAAEPESAPRLAREPGQSSQ